MYRYSTGVNIYSFYRLLDSTTVSTIKVGVYIIPEIVIIVVIICICYATTVTTS